MKSLCSVPVMVLFIIETIYCKVNKLTLLKRYAYEEISCLRWKFLVHSKTVIITFCFGIIFLSSSCLFSDRIFFHCLSDMTMSTHHFFNYCFMRFEVLMAVEMSGRKMETICSYFQETEGAAKHASSYWNFCFVKCVSFVVLIA